MGKAKSIKYVIINGARDRKQFPNFEDRSRDRLAELNPVRMDNAEMAEDTDDLVASTSFSNELSSVPEESREEQPSEKQVTSAYDTDCH